ncbi:hypothetical protein ACFX2B_030135 [Malus domestica]
MRYAEVHVSRKDEASYMKDITLEEGDRPEIYTEEHEKLLGNTDKTWTMFVDGYGKDGKRIYDPRRRGLRLLSKKSNSTQGLINVRNSSFQTVFATFDRALSSR